MTGHAVPLNNVLLAQVKSGQVLAIDACMNLFSKAVLGANNQLSQGHADSEAVAVLNTFNNFHRSWFSATKIEDIIDHGPDTGAGTADIYDAGEPALSLTYHLFKANTKYQDVLTDSFGFIGLREENLSIKNLLGYTASIPNRRLYGNNATLDQNSILFRQAGLPPNLKNTFLGNTSTNTSFIMPRIQVGDLVGVAPQTQVVTIPNVAMTPLGALRFGETEPGLNFSYNFYSSFGGGVLGQPIYLMLNLGHPKGTTMTGAEKLPRRWVLNSMQTFLCSQFPTLRESDIKNYIDVAGTAPFRKSMSCLQCHATMDQAATTARNIVAAGSEYNGFANEPGKTTDTLTSYRAELPAFAGWSSSAVPNFHRQVPTGKLFFRSITGEIINQSVTGIAQLGLAMANTDDYYQCAAKHYFEFFTGISVSLYDRSDPRFASINSSLSAKDVVDRKFIETLAGHLRSSQSLSQLIKDIISSDYYQTTNFRPAAEASGD